MTRKMAKEKAVVDPRARGVQKVRVYPSARYEENERLMDKMESLLEGSMEEVLNKILEIPHLLNVTTPLYFKGYAYDGVEIYTEAPETDAQYAARMKTLDAQEAKDLALLAKLQAKYKGNKVA